MRTCERPRFDRREERQSVRRLRDWALPRMCSRSVLVILHAGTDTQVRFLLFEGLMGRRKRD